ncbi:aminoglycoside phosphotransferase family protein [Streptomyces clavuligerus]|uniref:aminoglycoside phosphotransferase family protein n=1 Tax=Streptomyces clavuligerus TaxID=1901 RepID=UPI0018D038EE|nr:aminoglycoside phosphotransferase family protein [Streptomyces clavuligerus]
MGFEAPRRLVRALGEDGGREGLRDWLDRLPAIAEETVARLGLDAERVVAPGGRGSLIVLVRLGDGTPAALKLIPPGGAAAQERAALAHWDGRFAVRLLDAPEAPAAGDALLLERLHPEVSLRSLPEAKALLEAAATVRRLWVPPPAGHPFETVADRTARQVLALRALDDPLATAALDARARLTEDAPEALLLHGSFRQGKVLAADRVPWLTVGPRPVVGERAYDLARLVRDRAEDLVAASSGPSAARRRVNRLADSLEIDPARLRGWALFRAVESGTRALAAGRVREAESSLEFASWL